MHQRAVPPDVEAEVVAMRPATPRARSASRAPPARGPSCRRHAPPHAGPRHRLGASATPSRPTRSAARVFAGLLQREGVAAQQVAARRMIAPTRPCTPSTEARIARGRPMTKWIACTIFIASASRGCGVEDRLQPRRRPARAALAASRPAHRQRRSRAWSRARQHARRMGLARHGDHLGPGQQQAGQAPHRLAQREIGAAAAPRSGPARPGAMRQDPVDDPVPVPDPLGRQGCGHSAQVIGQRHRRPFADRAERCVSLISFRWIRDR